MFYKYCFVNFYYTGKFSGKFINIGVVAYNINELRFKLLDTESAIMPSIINKESLRSAATGVNELLGGLRTESDFEAACKDLKIHKVKFSKETIRRPILELDGEINSLFRFYVERGLQNIV